MENKQELEYYYGRQHQTSGNDMVFGCVAGVVIGGPLLGMMGLCFLPSATLLAVTSPLLLIFSPVLFGGLVVFVASLAGFGVAATLATAGLQVAGQGFKRPGGGEMVERVKDWKEDDRAFAGRG